MAALRLHPLEEALARRLREDGIARDFRSAIVAVSAGPDSSALLAALSARAPGMGIRLFAFHVDHAQRGRESNEDRLAARALARDLSIPFRSTTLRDIPHGASEDLLRQARYEAFRAESARRRTTAVFLGHTADDLAETLLMRLIRGAGLDGLAGFGPRDERNGLWLLRPLIDCSRELILRYLAERRIPYRDDSSNQDPAFTRNRIRMRILPDLAAAENPRIVETLARSARHLRSDADCLTGLARDHIDRHARFFGDLGAALELQEWAGLHEALRLRVLRELCRRASGESLPPYARQVFDLQRLALQTRSGGLWTGWAGLAACRESGVLRFVRLETPGRPSRADILAALRRQSLSDPAAFLPAPAAWLKLGIELGERNQPRGIALKKGRGALGEIQWELREISAAGQPDPALRDDAGAAILEFSTRPTAKLRLAPAPLEVQARLRPKQKTRRIATMLSQCRTPALWRKSLASLQADERPIYVAGIGLIAHSPPPADQRINWRLTLFENP